MPAAALPAVFAIAGGEGLWNDFATYWLAGKLVSVGQSPYDLDALAALGRARGIDHVPGTGYSYPPPFAVVMVPLAALPFTAAASIFWLISLLAFGVAVAAWLRDPLVWEGGPRCSLSAAFLAGCYPPVLGSVFVGQVNLLVAAAVSVGVRAALRHDGVRSTAAGLLIGLGGIVKVVPLALCLPLAIARRQVAVVSMIATAATAMVAAWLAAAPVFEDVRRLAALNAPDPYWTNQSINGYVSRLALGNDRVDPVLPGIDPQLVAGLAATVLLLATVGLLLWSLPRTPKEVWLPLAIGLVLVTAVMVAPKNSFWNQVPALVGAAILASPLVGSGDRRHRWRMLLAVWYAPAVMGMALDGFGMVTPLGKLGTVLSGMPLAGLGGLWVAIGLQFRRFGVSHQGPAGRLRPAGRAG